MTGPSPGAGGGAASRFPYVPAAERLREFTWPALLAGAILGIIFGASSVYLVLKVGMTVSASIPVAVLSITLFRAISKAFGIRRATILENNIVQTTGSAGESIAFGVGVTMPTLLILGFEMSLGRTMLVSVLGGLLGILMMIPLRRAFIVQQHKELRYPEGTACAEVLIVGEEGGASAKTVFAGFGLAFAYNFINRGVKLFRETISTPIEGLKGAVFGMDVAPELLGVGYIIGPRIASIMVAGGVLAYLVLVPAIVMFGASQTDVLFPGTKFIRDMSPNEIRGAYILYIGAGAVAT
ncbi:MAG: OPT/YSL family transporter, partial [Planctomycetes bacterium]|nr:OPT/YSL family transporter [Planctomycetota bacterium]